MYLQKKKKYSLPVYNATTTTTNLMESIKIQFLNKNYNKQLFVQHISIKN
jgi:hypothetical protein